MVLKLQNMALQLPNKKVSNTAVHSKGEE